MIHGPSHVALLNWLLDGNLGYEFGMVQPCTIGIE